MMHHLDIPDCDLLPSQLLWFCFGAFFVYDKEPPVTNQHSGSFYPARQSQDNSRYS